MRFFQERRRLTLVSRAADPRLGARWSRLAVPALLAATLSACTVAIGEPPIQAFPQQPPVPGATLNAVYPANGGLLIGREPNGTLTMSGPMSDPLIIEAQRFYDTVQTPFPAEVPVDYPDPFTGAATPTRKTAPLTLGEWKRVFGLAVQTAGEGLQTYRDRAGVAVYYNHNELGLGRELGCARFNDGPDPSGTDKKGIACFVTNYGAGFRQGEKALASAMAGTDIRNTVCITYRPSMDPGYQIQFYVYGPDGRRQEWAQLDTLGPRPHPYVCMNCHGGGYDEARHLVKNAHFLPLDPNLVTFAEQVGAPVGLSRAGQEERLRVMNAMASETPLTGAQQTMLRKLYPGSVTTVGSTAIGDVTPDAWTGTDADREFYRGVIRSSCATCHLAGQNGLTAEHWTYAAFGAPGVFDTMPLHQSVCGTFAMPNAQPTSLAFWDDANNPGITVAGVKYAAAADAFLARRGMDRNSCQGLRAMAGCIRATDPNALCGGPVSGGAVCDAVADRCVPVVSTTP
jgi:hypothetical protein